MPKKVDVSKTPEEHLKEKEMIINEYILNSSETVDTIFHMLCECIALSRMIYGIKDWHNAQYQCCLGYFYITYRGQKYALQAESHAEIAIKLISYLFSSTSEPMNEQSIDHHNNNLIILCIILLSCYTLAKSKSIQNKKKEALNFMKQSVKAFSDVEKQLGLIRNNDYSSENLEQEENIMEGYYQQWSHCTLLRLDKSFFPDLYDMKLRIYCLYGKVAFENKKFILAREHYSKALKLIEEKYDSESKETVPIYQVLGRIEECKTGDQDIENAVAHFDKAYDKENDRKSLVELMRSVYVFSSTCLKFNLKMDKVEQLLGETLQMLATFSGGNIQLSNDCSGDKKSIELSDPLNKTNSSHDKSYEENDGSMDQCPNSQNGHSNEHMIKLTCSLRSLLVRIYIKLNRLQEALYLLQENLNIQEDTYGMYNKQVIRTRQLILSIYMVQGNFTEAVSQAEMCLSLEQFTFGAKSKRVNKTKEIVEALSSYKKSGNNPGVIH
ncbi:unnamed protein product [Heterobilharzia americana]|nr:unnamed protein product [Heterobilharzia americana]